MADISKYNGIEWANISKINGVEVANIASINGSSAPAGGGSSYEDLSTYTEQDEKGDLVVDGDKVTVASLGRGANAYLAYDFGPNYFGDFDIDFEFEITASSASGLLFAVYLSNFIGAVNVGNANLTGIDVAVWNNGGNLTFWLGDLYYQTTDSHVYGGSTSDLIYCTLTRVGSTGSADFFSDSDRQVGIASLSLTCETGNTRYLMVAAGRNDGGPDGNYVSGYVQNIEIVDEGGPNSYEDLTTYTEQDIGNNRIRVDSSRVKIWNMDRDELVYLYYDFGVDYFTDFEMNFELFVSGTTASSMCVFMAVTNTIGTPQAMAANDGISLFARNNSGSLQFTLLDHNTDDTDVYVDGGSTSNVLYCTMKRAGAVCTVDFYSDAVRETLIDGLSITCEEGAKRYLFPMIGRSSATTGTNFNGYVKNIDILSVG